MSKWIRALTALLALSVLVVAEDDKEDKEDEADKNRLKPWSKIGEGMETEDGFWKIHRDKKKREFWVEIPSSQIGKPFLMATSISGGTTMRGYQWNDWLLVWERHDKKLVLLERNVGVDTSSGSKARKDAVSDTYRDRVITTYGIKGKGKSGGYVLDGRSLFASSATTFFGGLGRSKDFSLAKFDGSKNFPKNTEIRVTMPRSGSGTLITLAYSLSALPKTGYKPRESDDRIGYFTTVLKDFSEDNKDDNRYVRYLNRWNIQKADPKLDLSEPKNPIVFYIEKTVPVSLRRAVREGILEWNEAFEKIGFDNAIRVRQQTDTAFADLDPEDVNNNFFRWIYSETPFAMGPSRVDPRTGEILDADILFDDAYIRFTLQEYRLTIRQMPTSIVDRRDREVLKLHPLRRLGIVPAPDEFADAVPADAARPNVRPFARRAFCSIGEGARHQLGCCSLFFSAADAKQGIPQDLLDQFVKDTVMHEVGHTLGLRHNFKASIYRSYEEINSDRRPADIGGSVMDYQPIVIAADGQPQGHWAMRTLGPYDFWAIEYGYTEKDADLPKVLERVAQKGLDYATDEDRWSYDPYVNTWDMGADPLAYAKERFNLMKRLRKTLEERSVDKGERYYRLRRAMDMQFYEARWAAGLAIRFVGGEHIHRDHRGDPGARPPLDPVAPARQREAMKVVCDEILSGRFFEFDPELLKKLAPDFWVDDFLAFLFSGHEYPYLDNVLAVQMMSVYALTSPSRLQRVLDARHKTAKGGDVLTVPEVFNALEATIFEGLKEALAKPSTEQAPALDDMKRNLQREYVTHLNYILLEGEGRYPAPVQTLARHYVKRLAALIGDALKGAQGLDIYTLAHLEECQARLSRALEASYNLR